ncbi:hypothetical protein K3495_g15740, partial [Podosphaera aphanis]
MEHEQDHIPPEATLSSSLVGLTIVDNPVKALHTANSLLSRGDLRQKLAKLREKIGRSTPHSHITDHEERAWDVILRNRNEVSRHLRERNSSDANCLVQEIRQDMSNRTFPTQRRPEKLAISDESQEVIDEWFGTSRCKLGTLIPSQKEIDRVKRLLYTYRELNATESSHITPTDLYEHKVRLRKGTKPYSVKFQRRWPPEKEFWLIKIVKEAMACGMYERTLTANGELSDWNADAVLVNKPGQKEPRITFNYGNVWEDMPGCYLELMSKVHDYLSNPAHQFYHQFDLKHGYWCVPVYPPHRHMFAFTISGIGQLQPTRMPQG